MRSVTIARTRTGFVLMATLWLVVGIAVAVLAMNTSATRLALGSRNRANSRRSYWHALGCLAGARSRADEALDRTDNPTSVWESLPHAVITEENNGCRIEVTAVGTTLDVNHSSAGAIRIAAERAGLAPDQTDSVLRVLGPPRSQPFRSVEELRAAGNGMLGRFGISTLFGVDTDKVNLARSPPPVVAGALSDVVSAVGLEQGQPPGIMRPATTYRTPAWWVSASASSGEPPSSATVAVRLVMIGRRAATQEVRTW